MLEAIATKIMVWLVTTWAVVMGQIFPGYHSEGFKGTSARVVYQQGVVPKACREWRDKYPDLDLNQYPDNLLPFPAASCPPVKK